jgi:acyl-CoA reductase-like NAD-dependent aldehyde dehydrogenase
MMDALATADKAFLSSGTRPIEERANVFSSDSQLLHERKSDLAMLATLEMDTCVPMRTCEVGMEHATHAPYESFGYALKELTRER